AEVDRRPRCPIEVQAAFDPLQVAGHYVNRVLDAPGLERGEQGPMLVVGAARRARSFVDRDDQRRARHELAQEPRQDPVARDVREEQVELSGQTDGRGTVVTGVGGLLAGDVAQEPLARRRREPLRDAFDDVRFDDTPRGEHLARVLRRGLRDIRSAVRAELDGLVVGEPQEDPPDAGAAHREERREGFLAELGAGREPLLEDGPVDAVVDEVVDVRTHGVPRHPCSSADYVYKNLLHCKQHCRIYTANAGRQEGPMTTLRRAAEWLAPGGGGAARSGGGVVRAAPPPWAAGGMRGGGGPTGARASPGGALPHPSGAAGPRGEQ